MRINKENKKMIWGSVFVVLCLAVCMTITLYKSTNKTITSSSSKNNSTSLYTEDIKGFNIDTSYGNLVFPEELKEYIKTEIEKTDDCEKVKFWAKINDKEEIHIFDILFGGTGYKVGSIKKAGSKEIDVHIESYSYELDDSWSQEEKETISTIEYNINYLLESLKKIDNFTPVE